MRRLALLIALLPGLAGAADPALIENANVFTDGPYCESIVIKKMGTPDRVVNGTCRLADVPCKTLFYVYGPAEYYVMLQPAPRGFKCAADSNLIFHSAGWRAAK